MHLDPIPAQLYGQPVWTLPKIFQAKPIQLVSACGLTRIHSILQESEMQMVREDRNSTNFRVVSIAM